MEKSKMTWGDLEKFYKEKTGNSALIKSLVEIYNWATIQKEIIVNEDDSLSIKNQSNEK